MKFAVNSLLFTGTMTTDDLPLLNKVADMGFDTLEVTPVDPDAFPAKALRARAADLGLSLNANFALPVSANTISPDPAVRQAGIDLGRKVVDLCVEAGVEIYCGANYCAWGYLPGRRRTKKEWDWGVEAFRAVCAHAADAPITLAVETLNRFESHFLNTAADAVRFVEEVGLPNAAVHLDTFHMLREEDDLAGAIRATGNRMAYFHACGSQRGVPGRDMVPWDATFEALHAIGYDGTIGIESFNPDNEKLAQLVCIWRDFAASPDALATESLAYLKVKTAEVFGPDAVAGLARPAAE
ncbi:sugar phosphate isomerase/epimerase family protein [Roseisalinus antarcticus]|uniref:D-tagatose 3-epimerase n=1 Tax=Roseisalinus antarcticus TaxID=254357 RepID=A0A1Y5SZD5_9RHOB|nr:sugar phosphate isomerase/epimerase family protein [Roseisalinus antarcticus]SLN52202.1 D-tagatose 3-epimerase [Roseisalinus antarcticus]